MGGFVAVDYVIFIAIFAACIGIGIYHGYKGRKQGTTSAYLMGDRKLQLVPVTVSMVVSVMSANTLLGVPAESYNYGIQIGLKAFGAMIGGLLSALVFVPLFYPLKVTSTYEYLELRFQSKWVRRLGSVLLIVAQCMYVGSVIVGSALAFRTAVGIPSWASVMIIGVLGSLDTALGGFKGVIWTDVFQCIIMFIGLVIVLVKGVIKVGGAAAVWELNEEWGRVFISTESDVTQRMNLLSGVLGFTFTWWAFYGVSQPQVQRFCSIRTKTRGVLSMVLNPIGFSLFHLLSVFTGLVVAAYYIMAGCDPIRAKYISNSNQLLVYFVLDVLDMPGMPGAFISCLFCAALSSQSSSLNSMAAVLWEDFLADRFSHWKEKNKSYFLRVSVLVLGAISGVIVILFIFIGGNLQQIAVSFYSFSLGPLLGMFLLGAFVPFANSKGAFLGGLISLIITGWLLTGQTYYKTQRLKLPAPTFNCTTDYTEHLSLSNTTSELTTTQSDIYKTGDLHKESSTVLQRNFISGTRWLYSVSFVWYAMIGCLITLVIGIIVSLLTGCNRKRKIPKKYFSYLIHPLLHQTENVSTKPAVCQTVKSHDSSSDEAVHMLKLGTANCQC